jgi:hypothetical protein
MQWLYANQLIYGPNIKIYNTKNKLQATDFTLAESNLAKDSDSKITAKCYCPDPGRNESFGVTHSRKSYA